MVDEAREPQDIFTMGDVTVDFIEGEEVNQVIQQHKEMRIYCSRKGDVTFVNIDYKDFAYVDKDGNSLVKDGVITGYGYVRVRLNDEGLRQLIDELIILLNDEEG